MRFRMCLLAIVPLWCLSIRAVAVGADDAGFRPIFDGQSLSGWKGDEQFWRVEQESIVGESTAERPLNHNTFLIWDQGELDDFTLRLQFKLTSDNREAANSGIQFRSDVREDGHVFGYQADIDLAGNWIGALYDELGRGMLATRGQKTAINEGGRRETTSIGDPTALLQAFKPDDWNEYEISAQGSRITLKINGATTAEVDDRQSGERDLSGLLALQLHSGPPQKIEFRNIRLKRLPLDEGRKKVVFFAGRPSHGPREHEHNAGCLLLASKLDEAAARGLPVLTTVYRSGWPQDPTALDNADTVVFYCDGGGGHFVNNRLEEFERLAGRGVGLVCIHYAVEVPQGPSGDRFLDWIGGYFEAHWSVNPHWTANFQSLPDHPVARGVEPFEVNDEWYYHMRFRDGMENVTPILSDLPPRETLTTREDGPHSGNPAVRAAVIERQEPQHVAWAFERPDGKGRGFGYTGGHFHRNWQNDGCRKVILNAIVWTAGLDVPESGVETTAPSDEEMLENLDPKGQARDRERQPRRRGRGGPGAETRAVAQNRPAAGPPARPRFSSPVVTTQTPGHAVDIDADIAGASSLFLVVTDGGNG
ncbi:MAG: DUF1080 domain-containing protein, partial [Planctomycetaceae bacterium]|nr:DUF1080 domain-containing protein [Planctomycetaceae bacterium]